MNIAEFPISTLLSMVASLLESVIDANDRLVSSRSGDSVTVFHSRAVPNIKVKAYLSRILKYTPFNNEVLLCILVYFDRIAQIRPGTFIVNSYNIHRLLIASVVVASKFTSDVFYPNSRYAKVGGLPLLELNKLEMEFLFLCDFELHVRLEAMQEYGDNLLAHSRSQQQLEVPVDPVNRKRSRTSSSEEHTIITIKNSHSSYHHVHLPLTPPYTTTSPRAIKRRR
ncbi:cyclin-domain-containing protein [Fennellomyces sp. T-0311]|nr:cyclin-domain-containing protein [Fennellomyces sp. T-0311]